MLQFQPSAKLHFTVPSLLSFPVTVPTQHLLEFQSSKAKSLNLLMPGYSWQQCTLAQMESWSSVLFIWYWNQVRFLVCVIKQIKVFCSTSLCLSISDFGNPIFPDTCCYEHSFPHTHISVAFVVCYQKISGFLWTLFLNRYNAWFLRLSHLPVCLVPIMSMIWMGVYKWSQDSEWESRTEAKKNPISKKSAGYSIVAEVGPSLRTNPATYMGFFLSCVMNKCP